MNERDVVLPNNNLEDNQEYERKNNPTMPVMKGHELLKEAINKYFNLDIVDIFGIRGNPTDGYTPYITLELPNIKENLSNLNKWAMEFKQAIQNLNTEQLKMDDCKEELTKLKQDIANKKNELNQISIDTTFKDLKKDSEQKLQSKYDDFIAELDDTKAKKEEEVISQVKKKGTDILVKKINEEITKAYEGVSMKLKSLFKTMDIKIKDPIALIKFCIDEIRQTDEPVNVSSIEDLRERIKEIITKPEYTQELSDAIESLDNFCDGVMSGKAKKGDKNQQDAVQSLRKLQWKLESLIVPKEPEKKEREEKSKEKEETTDEETPEEPEEEEEDEDEEEPEEEEYDENDKPPKPEDEFDVDE